MIQISKHNRFKINYFQLLVGIGVLILLVQCNSKPEQKTISFDEITPDSKRDYSTNDSIKTANQTSDFESLSDFSKQFVDSFKIEQTSIKRWDTTLFADRFGSKFSEKWSSKTEQDSLLFLRWTFKDSAQTKNTFFNWLDCFGPKCIPMLVGDERKIQVRSFVLLVLEKEIVYIESNRTQKRDELLTWIGSLSKNTPTILYLCSQAARGKTSWTTKPELLDFWENTKL